MTCPYSRSRHRWLRKFCSLLCVLVGCCSVPAARAQDLEKPLQSIDEDITSLAFAPDNRIVYSVYRRLKTKQFDALEHDDIWLLDASGKRRRLLEGLKFTHGTQPFSYIVNSLRWSPNGRMLLAGLFTTTVLDDSGRTEDSFMTLVLDDGGHEIRIAKGDRVIPDAANAFFLPDNNTIVYFSEAVKPRLLFSLKSTQISSGSLKTPYEGRAFRDIAPLRAMERAMNFAIVVEQNHAMTGPARLQNLDLVTDADRELATLDGYESGLTVSPSGKKIAYFIDREVLEIRDLTSPARVARARVGLGVFFWSPDESRILLKRSIEKKSGDLVWIDLPPLAPVSSGNEIPIAQPTPIPILHGLTFREFAISPDGRLFAVIIPGKRNLLAFPLPR
jgi:hypothetical protein